MSDSETYDIVGMPTKKDNLPQRHAMKENIIPRHPQLSYIVGRTGSGKTNMIMNLLTKSKYYGKRGNKKTGYFDEVHVFAPTAKSDDMYETLELKEEFLHDKLSIDELQKLIDSQKKDIEKKGIDKSKRILIIYDDVLSNPKFMKSEAFAETIFANRHINASVWLLSQSYTAAKRRLRLQARHCFYFPGSNNESEMINNEFIPPKYDKKDMKELINFATQNDSDDDYNFLYINMNEKPKTRFRKNLSHVIKIYPDDDTEQDNYDMEKEAKERFND